MKETKLLGTLLPSNEKFIPILKDIREKYSIPEIDSIMQFDVLEMSQLSAPLRVLIITIYPK